MTACPVVDSPLITSVLTASPLAASAVDVVVGYDGSFRFLSSAYFLGCLDLLAGTPFPFFFCTDDDRPGKDSLAFLEDSLYMVLLGPGNLATSGHAFGVLVQGD
jgi:hypothetical protein